MISMRRKVTKKIVTDKILLPLIKKMMELMFTGNYAPLKIREMANNEWGFRTPKGKKLGRSTIYRIFTNTFYYGMYEYPLGSGNTIKSNSSSAAKAARARRPIFSISWA